MIPADSILLPPGTPSWITTELVAKTIHVWQPHYDYPLTIEEAVDMIINVGSLCRICDFSKGVCAVDQ